MKKVKNALLTILGLALVAVLSVAGTLAYLQDDDSDVNVMTMGNVKIAQHEYERVQNEDGTYPTKDVDGITSYVLRKFTQAKPLLPIVGDPSLPGSNPEYKGWDTTIVRMAQVNSYGGMNVFAGKNAQDKFVTVENTGRNDAYVRTLVAIEIGEGNHELIGTSHHQTWSKNEIGTIEVDGNKYVLIEYLYNGASGVRHENGILPAGDTTYPNLSQVYLKSKATNEDCENLDGNGNGKLDILVLSQAVQASGFDKAQEALDIAFGKSSEEAAQWFGGMTYEKTVKTIEELENAIAESSNITLSQDITNGNDPISIGNNNVIIDGQNNTITAGISNGYSFNVRQNGSAEFNDVNIVGGGINVWYENVVFNSGSINLSSANTSQRHVFYAAAGAKVIINDGTFSFDVIRQRTYACADGGTIIINGGTFGAAPNHPRWKHPIYTSNGGKVIINGGTFGFDPTEWVAAGHTVVNNGNGTWTVQ